MNTVNQTGGLSRQRAPRQIAIATVKLPIYARPMFLLLVLINLLVVGWTILLRQDVQLTNPFSEYADILPGQPKSAVLALQFSCKTMNDTYEPMYCTRAPVAGDFSLVTATLSNDVVRRVDFIVRKGALVVGELSLAWGRPQVSVYGQSVNLEWWDLGVAAGGHAQNRRFGYFVPLFRLSITASKIPISQ